MGLSSILPLTSLRSLHYPSAGQVWLASSPPPKWGHPHTPVWILGPTSWFLTTSPVYSASQVRRYCTSVPSRGSLRFARHRPVLSSVTEAPTLSPGRPAPACLRCVARHPSKSLLAGSRSASLRPVPSCRFRNLDRSPLQAVAPCPSSSRSALTLWRGSRHAAHQLYLYPLSRDATSTVPKHCSPHRGSSVARLWVTVVLLAHCRSSGLKHPRHRGAGTSSKALLHTQPCG